MAHLSAAELETRFVTLNGFKSEFPSFVQMLIKVKKKTQKYIIVFKSLAHIR